MPRDVPRAIGLSERACELGDRNACFRAGGDALLGRSETVKDAARAAKLFRKGCDLGDPQSCFFLGKALDESSEPQDAFRAFQAACAKDVAGACNELARYYNTGRAVAKDAAKAQQFFEREVQLRLAACDDGSADECQEIARNYRMGAGLGMLTDLGKAREFEDKEARWRQQACDAGSFGDCTLLRYFFQGRGDKVRSEAARLRECKLGNLEACQKPLPQ